MRKKEEGNSSSKKRVLIYLNYLCDGGAERVASLWANYLAEDDNFEVFLLTNVRSDKEYELSSKVNRLSFDDFGHIKKIKKIFFFRKLLKEKKIDYLIPFLYLPSIISSLSARHLPIKVLHNIRCSPWIDPPSLLARKIRDHFVKVDKHLIVQNEEQSEYFKKFKKVKTYVVNNPINAKCLSFDRGEIKSISKIMAVGRLTYQKNYPMAFRVIENLLEKGIKNVTLDIYGEGEDRKLLEDLIKEKNLENHVFLRGNVTNVFEEETKHDLLIMTSRYEGFPNALLEGMSVGLPVISTNCKTGPRDLVKNAETGFLVNEDDDKEMSERIIELISDVKLANRLAKNGKKHVLAMCDMNLITKTLKEALLDE